MFFLFCNCNYFQICIFYTYTKKLHILNEFYVRLKHIACILCSIIVSFTKLHVVEMTDFALSKSILSLSLSLSLYSRKASSVSHVYFILLSCFFAYLIFFLYIYFLYLSIAIWNFFNKILNIVKWDGPIWQYFVSMLI